MYTFTYQKTLLHTLLLLVFKIVDSLQYILKSFKMTLNSKHRTKKLKIKDTETGKSKTQKVEQLVLQKNKQKMHTYTNL